MENWPHEYRGKKGVAGKIDVAGGRKAERQGRKCCGHTRFAIISARGENVTLGAPVIDAKAVLNREFNL